MRKGGLEPRQKRRKSGDFPSENPPQIALDRHELDPMGSI
jgi:hypothetical protein